MLRILKILPDWAHPLWCRHMAIKTKSWPPPLQNTHTNLFRMDPVYIKKKQKQNKIKKYTVQTIVWYCLWSRKELGGGRVRAGWAPQSRAPMTACLLSRGPLGCCLFPSLLCSLIGHKCSWIVLGCLASFLLMLNVTWAWSLGSEMVLMKSHTWGGAAFPVQTFMSESGAFATNPHFCSPGRNWDWQQWRKIAPHEIEYNKMLNDW